MRFALIALLGLLQASAAAQGAEAKVEIVRQFVAAYNAQDAARMGEMVTEDIQWLSVVDGKTSIEVEGRSKLVAAMGQYFVACPSCRSVISSIMPSRDRVSVVEVASWETEGTPRTQQALAVYEFSGSLISAVYYFPSESAPPVPD